MVKLLTYGINFDEIEVFSKARETPFWKQLMDFKQKFRKWLNIRLTVKNWADQSQKYLKRLEKIRDLIETDNCS